MNIPIYQIDAFTDEPFKGNPAAVCPLQEWLPDDLLQNIASENNLSETAFFVDKGDHFHLRWFTPTLEVDLCGHATLASAYVLYNYLDYNWDSVCFRTQAGDLIISRQGDQLAMDFPAWNAESMDVPDELVQAFAKRPLEALKSRDCIVLFESQQDILDLKPEFTLLEKLDWLCTIATAPGAECDFVSRVFVPKAGIPEDPVTGSAHSSLIPYWAAKLGKTQMKARQLSKRTGTLHCEYMEDRVKIAGKCAPFMIGTISL